MVTLSKNILFWFRISLNLSSRSAISLNAIFFFVRVQIMLSLICGARVEEGQEWTCRPALLSLPLPKSGCAVDAAKQGVPSRSAMSLHVLQGGLVASLSNNLSSVSM